MTNARRIYDDDRHAHFVTFSCYKRRTLLKPDRAKRIVIGTLGSWLAKRDGLCIGFVIMPDHVHALVWFDRTGQLSGFMDVWKTQASVLLKRYFEQNLPEYWSRIRPEDPVWQARYYSFNVYGERKLSQKLDYMHLNPVRAGLVERAVEWPWSSVRWYLLGKTVGIPIRMPPGIF